MIAERRMFGQHSKQLFDWLNGKAKPPREVLVEGAAGTGKTHTDLRFLHAYGIRFPRSRIVLIRNERTAMSETILAEWEEFILGPDHYAVRGGPSRANREKYVLNNGTEYLCRGFDNETKLFSGQFHVGLVNEATEIRSEEKWETLHRACRAECIHPGQFRLLLAEVNPREEWHWINERAKAGRMHRITTKLSDNPRWYDHDRQEWTGEGRAYIGNLSAGLSGHNRERLLLGQWSNATGAVLPEWDRNRHVIEGEIKREGTRFYLHSKALGDEPVELLWFYGAMDAGYENAGVLGIWGVDRDGTVYEVCEVYRHHWTHDDWARVVVDLVREFPMQGLVGDHDKALIAAINRALLTVRHAPVMRIADKTLGMSGDKGKTARIEMMRSRLQRGQLFYLANCNRHVDEALKAQGMPWNTTMELPRLRYVEFVRGEDPVANAQKVDKRVPDHGFDMTLYGLAFAASRATDRGPIPLKPAPGTAAAILGPEPWNVRKRRTA